MATRPYPALAPSQSRVVLFLHCFAFWSMTIASASNDTVTGMMTTGFASNDITTMTTTPMSPGDGDLTRHPDSIDQLIPDTNTTTSSLQDFTRDLIFGIVSGFIIFFLLVAIVAVLFISCSYKLNKVLVISDEKEIKGTELIELKEKNGFANVETQASLNGTNSLARSEASYHNYESTDLTEGPPRGIPVADYPRYVHLNRQSAELVEEFQSLPEVNDSQQSYAREEQNVIKNRYKNVLPYNHSRVVLEKIPGDPHSDYINASYIDSFDREKAFIASQGPKQNTIADFWRMVWQEKIRVIAMVTNMMEGLKKKCEPYAPGMEDDSTPNNTAEYGNIIVELDSTTQREFGTVRIFWIRKSSGAEEARQVTHYQFTKWPDKSVPKRTSSFLRYLKEVKQEYEKDNTAPLLVHCSAGIGRTGVVIALDSLYVQAKKTGMVDVQGFVQSMRLSRQNMVQTDEQYVFLHEALLEMLLCGDTQIPMNQFKTSFQDLRLPAPDSSESRLDVEFAILDKLCPDPAPRAVRTGKLPECESKNRDPSVLPIERNRVMLQTGVEHINGGDYINASHIIPDEANRFMVAQTPLPSTLSDFWTLIYDYKPDIVVMLSMLDTSDPSCVPYWPAEGSMEIKPFTITNISTEEQTSLIKRTLQCQLFGTKNTRTVQQYQFLGWPGDDARLNDQSRRLLIDLVKEVYPPQSLHVQRKVLIHCMDGSGRSGVFCTLKMCLDQIAENNAVDIFQTVKSLRHERMRMVITEREYLLCYEVIDEFIKFQRATDYENLK